MAEKLLKLVAQAAQVASAQPERVRSPLPNVIETEKCRSISTASAKMCKNIKIKRFAVSPNCLVVDFSVSE